MKKLAMILFLVMSVSAMARPGPQWANAPAAISQWFKTLMQPDNPTQSCCGESDAFEADDYETVGDHYVAVLTSDRIDLGSSSLSAGLHIDIPNEKINWKQGNPTGHGYVFLGASSLREDQLPPHEGNFIKYNNYTYTKVGDIYRILYCFVPPSGV